MKVYRVCFGLLLGISLIISVGVAQADPEENSSRIQSLEVEVTVNANNIVTNASSIANHESRITSLEQGGNSSEFDLTGTWLKTDNYTEQCYDNIEGEDTFGNGSWQGLFELTQTGTNVEICEVEVNGTDCIAVVTIPLDGNSLYYFVDPDGWESMLISLIVVNNNSIVGISSNQMWNESWGSCLINSNSTMVRQ
jgi:hypothetical protein